ncbi:MAG: hypothetical protein MPL62_11225 [Alphaproteobacteria bacterium]|nr:hypothetical protein [Alphaproteobacteria bacterium]
MQFLLEFGMLVKLGDEPCDIWQKWGPKVMALACQEKKCNQKLQSCENEGMHAWSISCLYI